MAEFIRLQHITFGGDETFYFYDGELKVHGGILSIPLDRPDLHARAWMDGYRIDPETGLELTPDEVLAKFSA